MSRPQLTLASLLGVVAVIALGLAGLLSASTFWTTSAATVTLACLLASALGAILLRGPERSFSLGFAVFGLVYLILVNWDWIGGQFGHDLTAGLGEAAERMIPAPVTAATAAPVRGPSLVPFELIQSRQIRVGNFVQIGRMSLAMMFAFLGGIIGRSLQSRGMNDGRPTRSDST
jgi:hypothetical protein